ncbi:unnamed protein product [Arctogadus glacialis]
MMSSPLRSSEEDEALRSEGGGGFDEDRDEERDPGGGDPHEDPPDWDCGGDIKPPAALAPVDRVWSRTGPWTGSRYRGSWYQVAVPGVVVPGRGTGPWYWGSWYRWSWYRAVLTGLGTESWYRVVVPGSRGTGGLDTLSCDTPG